MYRRPMCFLKARDQKCQLCGSTVIADVETTGGSLAVLRCAFPAGNPIFDFEVFVDGRFQIIIASFVDTKRKSTGVEYVDCRNLRTAAAIVELERGLDAPLREIGI